MINGIFRKLMKSGGKSGSKNVAKQRLKFALIYDRLEVSDDTLNNLNRDVIEVISRYFEIDKEAFKLDIQRYDDVSALVVNTPIIATKHKNKLNL
ncbi:cell division topological specificity factor MinE [Desulfococcaceae bacterium HSG7]|nr:cell division topological specificity factor MinE [Desulfococcaceae bacterium HSG9]MDM8556756.1 cell division topological specificity factor MinE [Desulfococcaceae bacterium HSG7]